MRESGQVIKRLREQRFWTQARLAEVVGVSQREVQRWESSKVRPSKESLLDLAGAFDIDVEQLVDLIDEPSVVRALEKVGELIDDLPEEQQESLRKLGGQVQILSRVKSGSDLCGIIGDAHVFIFHNEELHGGDVEFVAEFFQNLQDYGDIWNDIGAGEHVRIGHELSETIKECEGKGFQVFGKRINGTLKTPTGADGAWRLSVVYLVSSESPAVVNTESGAVLPLVLDNLKVVNGCEYVPD